MEKDLWAYVRLTQIRKEELRKEIAKGKRNKNKWWWSEEEERYHQKAIQELESLTKGA